MNSHNETADEIYKKIVSTKINEIETKTITTIGFYRNELLHMKKILHMIKHYFFNKGYFSHDLLKKALEIFCCGKNPFLYIKDDMEKELAEKNIDYSLNKSSLNRIVFSIELMNDVFGLEDKVKCSECSWFKRCHNEGTEELFIKPIFCNTFKPKRDCPKCGFPLRFNEVYSKTSGAWICDNCSKVIEEIKEESN